MFCAVLTFTKNAYSKTNDAATEWPLFLSPRPSSLTDRRNILLAIPDGHLINDVDVTSRTTPFLPFYILLLKMLSYT